MNDQLRTEILKRLSADFKFKHQGGTRWSGGQCPKCPDSKGKELYVYIEKPWTVVCGRESKCGARIPIKELYPDLFDNWSDRHRQTEIDPHAAARAYLRDGRGLDVARLANIYSQELYRDWKTKQTSATVRFAVPYGADTKTEAPLTGFWERLIDRPGRFGKRKANIPAGWSYKGHAWHHPAHTLAMLAAKKEVWIAEGIFDACALNQSFGVARPHALAVSSLSTNNYPENFLETLAAEAKRQGLPRPTIIWAFDVGSAGVKYTREYVAKSAKAGWTAKAAQVTPDGEGEKRDWNDLLIDDDLTAEDLEIYLENGAITVASSVAEKAFFLWMRSKSSEFALIFGGETFWARFSAAEINQLIADWDEAGINIDMEQEVRFHEAARASVQINEIANCAFRALYYQRREDKKDGNYYFRITFPGKTPETKANLSPEAVGGASKFKVELLAFAGGALFTGSNLQLEKIMKRQLNGIRTVIALQFRGYSIQHGAWIFDKIAIVAGRVVEVNDDDFFQIGPIGLKLPSSAASEGSTDRFEIATTLPDGNPWFWWEDFHTAFGPLGTVALSFWLMSMFAEQIRRDHQDMGFLEMSGEPGSGKSTLLIFLWKLVGRLGNYEGFDPARATAPGLARELVKVANLPVVMIEGDRQTDQPQQKRFDWDELKPLYNGNPPRTRAVANDGVDTFSPRFRGSIVIAQNHAIKRQDADQAVLERIVGMTIDKSRFSDEGLTAGESIKALEVGQVSHWLVAMVRQEKQIITAFTERFHTHFKRLRADPHVLIDRLARTHGQIAAALDCLGAAMKHDGKPVIAPEQARAAHELITQLCRDRHCVLDADHPVVALFWENFDYLDQKVLENKGDIGFYFGLNYSRRKDQIIAVNLPSFERESANYRMNLPAPITELKKLLLHSKSRKFIRQGTVNCIDGKARHCWIFAAPTPRKMAEVEDV